ncbi:hypothetical protein QQM79_20985 [Marinobacteraceae bacterium S3BR75-40.1]
MAEQTTRLTMQQIRKLKSLSDAKKFKETTEAEIDKQISEDPDLYQLTDEELAQFELARREK